MDTTFKLEIVTPYRVFYSGPAEMIIVDSADGELGILANHEPVVASVVIGLAKIRMDGVWKTASVSEGFLEVEGNRVTVLVGAAEWPEEIDIERAERSLKRARDRLDKEPVPVEVQRSSKAVSRAKTRLHIAGHLRDKKE
jgi:F-type H+-transporting ATPase subunit epsilon